MSRKQTEGGAKSVAFTIVKESSPNEIEGCEEGYAVNENDEIGHQVSKTVTLMRRNVNRKSPKAQKSKGFSVGSAAPVKASTRSGSREARRIAEEFKKWSFKHVVDMFGENHDIKYADTGEKIKGKDW